MLLALCGKKGDCLRGMSVAKMLHDKFGEFPDVLIHSKMKSVEPLLKWMKMPIREVVYSSSFCPVADSGIFGLSWSRWSDSMLRHLFPGHERYYNCCPRHFPNLDLSSCMCYCAGLVNSPQVHVEYPVGHAKWNPNPSGYACYHFGSDDYDRCISIESDPFPSLTSVCLGGPDDKCPDWIDVDMRSNDLVESAKIIVSSNVMVGSDSLFSHISGMHEVPTICVMKKKSSLTVNSRSVYRHGADVLSMTGLVSPDQVIMVYEEIERKLRSSI